MRLLAAALLLSLYSCSPDEKIKAPSSRMEQQVLHEEVKAALRHSEILEWRVVDLKGGGNDAIFVVTKGGSTIRPYILERRDGELRSAIKMGNLSPISAPYEIRITDLGNDGKPEVNVNLPGRKIYYIWAGMGYSHEEAVLHWSSQHPEKDERFYKDVDGDGTEEAVLICPDRSREKLFGAYKWRHGWASFRNEFLDALTQEYKESFRSDSDAITVQIQRDSIANRLRSYLR